MIPLRNKFHKFIESCLKILRVFTGIYIYICIYLCYLCYRIYTIMYPLKLWGKITKMNRWSSNIYVIQKSLDVFFLRLLARETHIRKARRTIEWFIHRWIFQTIRNKAATIQNRNPGMIAIAAQWLLMQIYILHLLAVLSLSLSLLLSVSLIQGRGEEEVELSAACPNSPWIMQTRCNWSPNRNGLLFTFLCSESTIRSFIRSKVIWHHLRARNARMLCHPCILLFFFFARW